MWLFGGLLSFFATMLFKTASKKSSASLREMNVRDSKNYLKVYPPYLESWKDLLVKYRGDIPLNCLFAWIKKESGGNPCSIGDVPSSGNYPLEYGLFQLHGVADKEIASSAEMRGMCKIGSPDGERKVWESLNRNLTQDEKIKQVVTGIKLVEKCRQKAREALQKAGTKWDEQDPDFWNLVKLYHASPAVVNMVGQMKESPTSWKDIRSTLDPGLYQAYLNRFKVSNPCEKLGMTPEQCARYKVNQIWDNCEVMGKSFT